MFPSAEMYNTLVPLTSCEFAAAPKLMVPLPSPESAYVTQDVGLIEGGPALQKSAGARNRRHFRYCRRHRSSK